MLTLNNKQSAELIRIFIAATQLDKIKWRLTDEWDETEEETKFKYSEYSADINNNSMYVTFNIHENQKIVLKKLVFDVRNGDAVKTTSVNHEQSIKLYKSIKNQMMREFDNVITEFLEDLNNNDEA